MKISNNFSLGEFLFSQTALNRDIENVPSDQNIDNIIHLVKSVMQPLRDAIGESIFITSGYRSKALNTAIGGSSTSDHCNGFACDFKTRDLSKAFSYIKDNLPFDQLIWEFGDNNQPQWVHVSFKYNQPNRMQVLKAIKVDGRTKYIEL